MRSSRRLASLAASGFFWWSGISAADVKTGVHADVLAAGQTGKLAQLQMGPGLGLGIGLGVRFTGVPLVLLGSASYIFHEGGGFTEPIANAPSAIMTTASSSRSLYSHLHARFQPLNSWFRPYVEASLGVSRVGIEVNREIEDAFGRIWTVSPLEKLSSHVLSYGFGLGAQIQIGSHGLAARPDKLTFLTFSVRYLTGGEVGSLHLGSARANGDAVAFDTIPTRNETAMILVGLLHEFDVSE